MNELGLGAKQGGLPEHDVGQLARLERAHMAADAMGDGGIDGVLAYIAFYPEIIVTGCGILRQEGRVCFFILSAVCQVRVITSATRPMACESELIMLNTPMSCRISSAAMVSGRMRESANATSSGTDLSR